MKVPEDGSAQKTRLCPGKSRHQTGHRLELALLAGPAGGDPAPSGLQRASI